MRGGGRVRRRVAGALVGGVVALGGGRQPLRAHCGERGDVLPRGARAAPRARVRDRRPRHHRRPVAAALRYRIKAFIASLLLVGLAHTFIDLSVSHSKWNEQKTKHNERKQKERKTAILLNESRHFAV